MNTVNQSRAREIMGKNFFGVEEAVKHFRVNPDSQQLAALAKIPFIEATLEGCKNTHILVADFGLSIRYTCGHEDGFEDAWYNNQAFVKEGSWVCYQLIRKTPAENSTSKNWQEQQMFIGKNEEIPSVRVMAYAIIGHHLATGERLFKDIYVRTSSFASPFGLRVFVGNFGQDHLNFYGHWNCVRSGRVGLASVRKLNS